MSKKAETVFYKLSQIRGMRDDKNIDDDWLTEDLKNMIAGGAGALTGTTATYPLDTRATAAQSKSYNTSNVKFKDLIKGETKTKKVKSEGLKGLMGKTKEVVEDIPRSETAKKLLRKNFSGLGPKLMKTIPAMGITFGTIGATKRILDEIDEINK